MRVVVVDYNLLVPRCPIVPSRRAGHRPQYRSHNFRKLWEHRPRSGISGALPDLIACAFQLASGITPFDARLRDISREFKVHDYNRY
jgi:hypothetical protein